MATKVEVELSLINKLTTGLNKATGDFKRFELNTNKSIAAIGAGWGKLLSLQNVFYGVGTGAIIKSAVEASMAFQSLQNSMMAAVGQFTNANNELEAIRVESNRIGVDFERVAGDYIKFAASSTRAGISLQKTRDIFTDLSETAVSLRLTPERTRLVFEALNQMASKGTVQMEELRGQLGDHIPAALNLAAKAMGMTAAEFYKAVKNGQILAYDFLPKFAKTVREEMGGGFETATQQLQANLSRLKNSWFQLRVSVGDAISPDLNAFVKDLAGNMTGLSEGVDNIRIAYELISTPINIAYNGFQLFAMTVGYLFDAGSSLVAMVLTPMAEVFGFISENSKLAGKQLAHVADVYKKNSSNKSVFEMIMQGDFSKGAPKDETSSISERFKNFIKTESELMKSADGMWAKWGARADKQLEDIADKEVKLVRALRGEKVAKAGTKGPYKEIVASENIGGTASATAVNELKKKWNDYFSWVQKWNKANFDTTMDVADANAEAFAKKSTNRELVELDIKFAKMKEKYSGFPSWMNMAGVFANIEKAYAIEKSNIMAAQARDTKEKLDMAVVENMSILNIEQTQYDQQLAILELKLKKEQELYAGNKKAIRNLEDTFYIERAVLQKKRDEDQAASMKSWVDTVTQSLITIAGENKKFVGLYKTASIVQIIADTMTAAQAAFKSMVQSFGAYGIPAGVAAAGVVTAAGMARVSMVANQKFGLGTREYRARGPQMIMVGDNPGGEETVTVRPTSSQNVNGPSGSSGGDTHFHFYDQSGDLVETVRRRVRSGGADRLTRDLFARGRMLGAVA